MKGPKVSRDIREKSSYLLISSMHYDFNKYRLFWKSGNDKERQYRSPNYGELSFLISEDTTRLFRKYQVYVYYNFSPDSFYFNVCPFSRLHWEIRNFIKKFHRKKKEEFEESFMKKCDEALAKIIKNNVSKQPDDLAILIRTVHRKVSEISNIPLETVEKKVLEIYSESNRTGRREEKRSRL